ncbi:hypothetical protein HF086_001626 [Spodoptera exigua]|uniref:NACHT domain-containing protein n=1 Tax=Spodoptera exigua TaxID=7107 RepID=A0A922MP07_SPOEX|nr:hypothetical protein HF086_001626 [Spodoptera exigua]
MQNNDNDFKLEDKFLYNSLLFACILKKKTPQEKIEKIKKYLERGADINAVDANYNNNTPLHLAVIKEEPEIVEFLLEKGAHYKKKNYEEKSALDIAHTLTGNLIKRKEIITLLETFADNNLKRANLNNINTHKTPKRSGCPFISHVEKEDLEETNNIRHTRDFREYLGHLSTSVHEENTKNTIKTKLHAEKEDDDLNVNNFHRSHCSKVFVFSSPRETNAIDYNLRIDEVTTMLENLVVRGTAESDLKPVGACGTPVYEKEELKIPSSNQGRDDVLAQENNFKISENEDPLVRAKKLVGSTMKQPQYKISYIKKNIEAISKQACNVKIPKGKREVKDRKKCNTPSFKENSIDVKISSRTANTFGDDCKTFEGNICCSLGEDQKPTRIKKRVKMVDDKYLKMGQRTDPSKLKMHDSQTSKNKLVAVQINKVNCDTKTGSAIIHNKTRITTEKKTSSDTRNKPVKYDFKQPLQSKYLKITSSEKSLEVQNAGATSSQKNNTKLSKNNDGNKIIELKKNDNLVKRKETRGDFKQLDNSKVSSQQHTQPAFPKKSHYRNSAKVTIVEGSTIMNFGTVTNTHEVDSVKDNKHQPNDFKQLQEGKYLKIASNQQDTAASKINFTSSTNEENKANSKIKKICDVGMKTKTAEDLDTELVKGKNFIGDDLKNLQDVKDISISSNFNIAESTQISDETKTYKEGENDLDKDKECIEGEPKVSQDFKDFNMSSNEQRIEWSLTNETNSNSTENKDIHTKSEVPDIINKNNKQTQKTGIDKKKKYNHSNPTNHTQVIDSNNFKIHSSQQGVKNSTHNENKAYSAKCAVNSDSGDTKTISSQQPNDKVAPDSASPNSKTSIINKGTKTPIISPNKKTDEEKEGFVKDKKTSKTEAKRTSNNKKSNKKKVFLYPKRTGTSGLSGQLYETKLLSLILLRSLYVQEVPKFFIGTNAENMGAFDDVIFRYYSENDQRPNMMFLQAKHRDNPAKEKFTVDELKKLNGDFSLHKYLQSYIKISQMFMPEQEDDMFIGEFKNIECEFIIYTSAFENFSKMKVIEQSKVKSFINTTGGKVFQFDYDEEDINNLVVTVVESRAVTLAKKVSKFIFKDNNNFNNMMMDEMIKTYHVFLARNIIDVQRTCEDAPNFYYATFRDSFLTSNDSLYMAFKNTLCKEAIQLKKGIGTDKIEEVESALNKPFKVPITFGNLNFCFTGNDQKKENKLEYLCSLFKKLFGIAKVALDNNIFIKIDDDNVGTNEILKSTDLETYRIGGLVGNLLILDDKTNTLKFNLDVETLSPDNIKLLDKLRNEVFLQTDPSKYRFDINVHRFPRLSLIHEKYDKGLIKDFLDKLIFYTNQATEDKVEEIVKKEIDGFFVGNIPRQCDQLFKVKSHAIFLKAHDLIQKWWKTPTKAPYLTESCQYFLDAEQDIINSPLLNILNFTYLKTIKNSISEIRFKAFIADFFNLKSLLDGTIKIMTITTEESALTSMKLLQNFKENHYSDYTFIDLDYIVNSNYFADVKVEVKESKIQMLIIVCNSGNFFAELNLLIKHFKGKIILISNRDLTSQIDGVAIENIVCKFDRQTGFDDLDDTMCEMLRNERYIIFQGKEVKLGVLFEDQSYHLINSNILYKIINNENTIVGKNFNNPSYDEILDYYIKEKVCRFVTLDKHVKANDDFDVVEYKKIGDHFEPSIRDVVLITDNEEEYVYFNAKYKKCNVHWFRNDGNCLVWQQSQGNLSNIVKNVKRNLHETYRLQLGTIKDLKEKIVIISAEPGMGKSSLLTHLAINTKDKHPTLWISKINLLDFINDFKTLKDNKVDIDFKEVVKFLFRAIDFEASRDRTCNFELVIDQVSVQDQDIYFNVGKDGMNVTGLNLFEIQLFVHSFNANRVALLFDGFDEICPDYASEFMQIANILRNSKLSHMWITSRLYNVLHQLECIMQTFSYTIEPLSEDDQMQFLEKIWSTRKAERSKMLDYFPFNKPWSLKLLIKGFLAVLTAVLTDFNRKFLSMPLHLYMISDIYQSCYHTFPLHAESYDSFISQQNTMNKINLNQIYERFIDIKFFKIRFGEKKPLLCINDPDMRLLIQNERETFFHNHKLIAAYVVFGKIDEINLFDRNDIKQIHEFIERIKLGEEKTGIIEQIIRSEPKFVHYTFAEYFAIEFLCDRLKVYQSTGYMWTYLINTFLESDASGPQRFFNAKLANHPNLYTVIRNAELRPMFENWLEQHEKMAKLIFKAVDQYLENTALFALKCIECVLTNININDFIKIVCKVSSNCIICIATKRSAENVITFIIDTVKNINANRIIDLFNCCDFPYSNPLLIAYGPERLDQAKYVLLHNFLSDLPPDIVEEIFCMKFDKKWFTRIKSKSYIHIVSELLDVRDLNIFNRALDKLSEEQLLKIFTIKDSDGKLAAHRAASCQSYIFFDKLESLVNKDEFQKICMTLDKAGLTPLHYFDYTLSNSDNLERLLDKVYGDEKTAKLTMKYFIDKRKKKEKARAILAKDSRGNNIE